MKIVEMDKAKGTVEVCRKVVGLVNWDFVYLAKDKTLTNNSNAPEPHCNPLGDPAALHRDINAWTVRIHSTSEAGEEYETRIEWKQEGRTIQTWSRKGDVSPADPTDFITDSATLLTK